MTTLGLWAEDHLGAWQQSSSSPFAPPCGYPLDCVAAGKRGSGCNAATRWCLLPELLADATVSRADGDRLSTALLACLHADLLG